MKGLRVDDGRGWVVRVDEVDDDGAVDARDGLLHGLKVDGPLRAHRHGDDLDVVLAGRVGAVAVGEFGTDEADAGTDVGLDARADRFGGAVREHHVLGLAAHEVGAGLAEPFGCDERVAVGVGQGCDRGVAGGGREAERIFVEAERHRLFGRGRRELGQGGRRRGLRGAEHEGARAKGGGSEEIAAVQGHDALRVSVTGAGALHRRFSHCDSNEGS